MGFYACSGGGTGNAEDGNDIIYPVATPSEGNKLYIEKDVSAIAYALGESLKISEMADAVKIVKETTNITTYKGTLAVVYADGAIYPYELEN